MQPDLKNSFTNAADTSAFVMPQEWIAERQSVWFQDFTFGGTMFDSAFGNVEGLSGVGLGVADRAVDEMIRLADEDRKKDDPALDTQELLDLTERQREERVRIGSTSMSREEIRLAMEVLNDPEKKERASQDYAARNGVSIEAGRSEMNWYHGMMTLVEKEANGTITATEQATLDRETSQPGFDDRFQRAGDSMRNVQNNADISLANNADAVANETPDVAIQAATTGPTVVQDAVVGQIDNSETQREALSRRGYASSQVDELAERQAGSGDELSALFGDAVAGPQLGSADTNSPAPTREMASNPAPMQG